jgi:hypothetical protein
MEREHKINFSPSKNDLKKIEDWLIQEREKYDDGFYCNWNIIENSFERNELISLKLNDVPIGFVVWRQCDIFIEIDIMEIHYDYRKKGLGKIFFGMISESFKDKGVLAIKLFCEPRESEHFWRKMGFIKFPNRGYSESDLTFYKPLIEVCAMTETPNKLNKIELWDVEPYQLKNNSPRWSWDISTDNGILDKPIIHPCNVNWNIRWTKNGKTEKEDKVKYFSSDNPIDFSPFMYINKLDE